MTLDLPLLNACLNGTSGCLLVLGLLFIKQGRREAHQGCMISAFATSCVFLVSYLYHKIFVVHGVNTPFPGPAGLKPWYLLMLFTHVVLAIAIVPLALITIVRGVKGRLELHRKIARITWPIWMYVSVTGVFIYLALYQIWSPAG